MPVDEHTIHFDQSPVFYRIAPAVTSVPVLYLHGVPTSSDDWAAFLERIGGIAPDMIGFGRSAKGGHLDYSPTGLAQFLEGFLDAVSAEVVNLVAHDWGAAPGLAFAQRHPDRVQRLVVCNAPPLLSGFAWPRVLRLWRTRGIGEVVMGATTRALLARTLRQGCVRPGAWTDSRVSAVWSQFDQGTQRAILRLVRSVGENRIGRSGVGELGGREAGAGELGGREAGPQSGTPPRRVGSGELGGREAGPESGAAPGDSGARAESAMQAGDNGAGTPRPTLIVWGERDPWYPVELGAAYAAATPGARLERIPDAGHWPWFDRPDVVDLIAEFLA